MDIFIPDNIEKIIELLEDNGFEAYIVGGCVRDSMLGKTPKDYDITTSAAPDDVKECLKGYHVIDTGLKHGTVTVVAGDDYVEVTTFRIDGGYSDHRRPDSVTFSDRLTDDLSRRDFTINAMAYNHRTGVIDEFGGQRDLFRQKIRCVGEPAVRFNEDALRIMRALRFASQLNFEIDKLTSTAIHDMRRLLDNISPERLCKELTGLICGASPSAVLTEYSDIIASVIPEIRPCIGFNQHSRYHVYDVWTHTAIAVENSPNVPEVRMALLLHDIAKPDCCRYDEEGSGHFPGHERAGAAKAEEILRRLRCSNDFIESVCTLIKYHYIAPVDDKIVVKQLLSKVGTENFFRLTGLMRGDSRAKQSFCFERVQVLEAMDKKARCIIDNKECISVSQLAVNGSDIAALGASGRQIGDILNRLLTDVIEEKCVNEKNALLSAAGEMLSE
ncbi:MAG: CCA tRNA nucleotidyltransferase [Oscillospiraceae bacterium]